MYFKKNTIQTQDTQIPFFDPYEYENGFLSIFYKQSGQLGPRTDYFRGTQLYWNVFLILSDQQDIHSRSVYTIFDMLGDFGGLMEVLMLISSTLVAPWSEFLFNTKAI